MKRARESEREENEEKQNEPKKLKLPTVKGLQLIPDFVTKDEEVELIRTIDSQPWDSTLSRRVQQYGFKYN